ncbi:MAG: uroporphyrinogen-III C-methyltransferase [Betaproteobacteria bacterium]
MEKPPTPPVSPKPRARALALLVAGAAAVALAVWAYATVQREQARQRQQIEHLTAELRTAQEQAAQRQAALDKLAAEVADNRTNAAALDGLVADLTRGRDELVLLEVDRLLTLAAHELQFGDDVPAALAALQAADARLARSETPRLTPLRQAIARDLQRLRAVPAFDLNGVSLKLDQMARASDQWPLLAQVDAPAKSVTARTPAAAAGPDEPGGWPRVLAWLQAEFGDLIQIRRAAPAEALLLPAPQPQLVRQQCHLRLRAARLALLDRNDALYRAELAEAQSLLARYFDGKAPAAAAAAAQLKQWAGGSVRLDLPNLADSLGALRSLRPAAQR